MKQDNLVIKAKRLYDMLAALEMAEDDLLLIGMPFCAKYQFHGKNAANKKRRNDALRRKYRCDEIEKELNNQRMLKYCCFHEARIHEFFSVVR